MRKDRQGVCRHCNQGRATRSRKLCYGCFQNTDIRELYPRSKRGGVGGTNGKPKNEEPTEEELEAIIAEQMKRLPKWWYRDAELMRREESPNYA